MNRSTVTVGVAVLCTVGLAACSQPQATATKAAPQTGTSEETAASMSPLEGAWTTTTISKAEVAKNLKSSGLADFADVVVTEQEYPTSWTVDFTQDAFTTTSAKGEMFDTGAYALDGSTLTMKPTCECTVVYHWTLENGVLTLALISDDSPDFHGAPDEAFERALYTTQPFARS